MKYKQELTQENEDCILRVGTAMTAMVEKVKDVAKKLINFLLPIAKRIAKAKRKQEQYKKHLKRVENRQKLYEKRQALGRTKTRKVRS